MRPVLPCLIIILLLLWPSAVPCAHAEQTAAAAGQSFSGSLGVGVATLNGDTLYHISSYDTAGNGIESELKFPLQNTLLGLQGGLVVKNAKGQDEFAVRLQWFTSMGSGSGHLQDSDWLTNSFDIQAPPSPPNPPNSGYPHPGLDIYSTSDVSSKAMIIDLRGSYNGWVSDDLNIGPLVGLLYQHFQFDASNVNQVGFGPYAPWYNVSTAGPVLTYEVTYTIPYLGAQAGYRFAKDFQATIDLAYSPLVSAKDTDDHLLRGKRSTGSTTGSAYSGSAGIAWSVTGADRIALSGQYLKITTTGTQTQTWYRNDGTIPAGTTYTGINDRIESQQTSLSLLLSHRF